MRIKITTKCFQNITRSFFHFKIKHMALQYKQELQNMNLEKPLLYHVFQLKFGQVYSVHWGLLPSTRLAIRIILIEQNIKNRTGPALCVLCA